MGKRLNTSCYSTNASGLPKNRFGRYKTMLILLVVLTIRVYLPGCADIQAATDLNNEFVTIENSSIVADTQILKETVSTTELDTEVSVLSEEEKTPRETAHIHNYISKITTPICTEGGYTTFICDCGDTYASDQTDAFGHNYHDKVTAPTCTENGYTTYTCSHCGDFQVGDKTNATGHSWSTWKVNKEPTTTTEGTERRSCVVCAKTESRSVAKLHDETKPVCETFNCTIGSYNAYNLAYKDWKGDTEQAAFIEVYTIEKNDDVLNDLAAEFEKVYDFAPSLSEQYHCTSACEEVGTYMVDGYSEPQAVFHYSITDKTYIYITNPMYTVYKRRCGDGSLWVGYCIYATMDTIDTERNKAEVQSLDQQMHATFEELIGLNRSEMDDYKEELKLKIGYISEAGTVRSIHVDKPVQVLYIYCRGFAYHDG